MQKLKTMYDAILDVIFPPKCPLCLSYVEEKGQVCKRCFTKVATKRYIPLEIGQIQSLDQCMALCRYRQGIQKLIRALKYQQRMEKLAGLHFLLQELLKQSEFSVDAVVPVPLSKERQRERGFNQTELIFRRWAEGKNLVWQDCLFRIKETQPQYGFARQERWDNMQGAFALAQGVSMRGKTILLVDDIFTTGATLESCAKTLKKAGARKIIGLVLASDDA